MNFRQNKSAACHLCRAEGRIDRDTRAADPARPFYTQMFRRQKTRCSTMAIFATCPITALCVLTFFVCATSKTNSATPPAQKKRIVIGASTLLDGRGHVLRD